MGEWGNERMVTAGKEIWFGMAKISISILQKVHIYPADAYLNKKER